MPEVVDTDDALAARQQGAGDVAADETRGAGDEDGHNDLRTGNALQNEWKERRAHAYNVSFRDETLKRPGRRGPVCH